MKKVFLSLCLIAACVGSVMAGPVDQQKAEKLGAKFLGTTAVGQKNADIQLNCVSAAVDLNRGGTDYYVFNVKGGEGFVIIAGDDRVKPVLAYSTSGQYDPQNVSEGFQFTLDSYREEINYVREHNLVATPDIVAEWNSVSQTGSLQKGRSTPSRSRSALPITLEPELPLEQPMPRRPRRQWWSCLCRLCGNSHGTGDEVL